MSNSMRWFSKMGRALSLMATVGLFGSAGCTAYSGTSGGYSSAEVGFSATYSDLNPYGRWVVSARFGQVWCPQGGFGWSPYADGYWAWTDQGWYWHSYEPYGWLVYHYGNWYNDDQFGWCWVPGESWSPATVRWIVYDDYVCWAPIPPRGVRLPEPWIKTNTRYWNVVRSRDFATGNISRVQVEITASKPFNPGKVMRHSPDIRVINKQVERPIARVKVDREPMKMGSRTFYKSTVYGGPPQRVERVKEEPQRKQEVQKKRDNKRKPNSSRFLEPRGGANRPHPER